MITDGPILIPILFVILASAITLAFVVETLDFFTMDAEGKSRIFKGEN